MSLSTLYTKKLFFCHLFSIYIIGDHLFTIFCNFVISVRHRINFSVVENRCVSLEITYLPYNVIL